MKRLGLHSCAWQAAELRGWRSLCRWLQRLKKRVRVKEKKIHSQSSQRISVFHILVSCIVQRRLWVWSADVRIFCAFVNKYQGEIPSYKIAVLYMRMYINTMMEHYCYYTYNLMYARNPFWMRYSWIITNHCSSWSNVPSLCRGYLMGFDWFWLSTDTR